MQPLTIILGGLARDQTQSSKQIRFSRQFDTRGSVSIYNNNSNDQRKMFTITFNTILRRIEIR